ncbi:hypothetical protein C8R48DRAFT_283011 [Suillus tomentosus]|nr:hypothetical protein C8R48DRAFT_283011 [Suillus tomentosus]
MAPSPTSPTYQSHLQNHLGDLAEEVVDLTANRGAFSQSLNIHLQSPTVGQLTSMARSEIGMYYLGTRPAAQAVQITIDQSLLKVVKAQQGKSDKAATSIPTPPLFTESVCHLISIITALLHVRRAAVELTRLTLSL